MINPSLKECAKWFKNTPAYAAQEIRAGFMTDWPDLCVTQ